MHNHNNDKIKKNIPAHNYYDKKSKTNLDNNSNVKLKKNMQRILFKSADEYDYLKIKKCDYSDYKIKNTCTPNNEEFVIAKDIVVDKKPDFIILEPNFENILTQATCEQRTFYNIIKNKICEYKDIKITRKDCEEFYTYNNVPIISILFYAYTVRVSITPIEEIKEKINNSSTKKKAELDSKGFFSIYVRNHEELDYSLECIVNLMHDLNIPLDTLYIFQDYVSIYEYIENGIFIENIDDNIEIPQTSINK